MIVRSAPGPAIVGLRVRATAAALGVFAAALALLAGARPPVALACGLLTVVVAASLLLYGRGRTLARTHRIEDESGRAARRDSAIRMLWAASGDFLAAGWGRNDLEALRLLALNLRAGQPLGPRVAERLRAAISAVLAGVLDRLQDVALTAHEIDVQPEIVGRLEAAIRVLVAELEDVTCRTGEPVSFRPAAVAAAATQALDACASLRGALRPYIVSDLPAIVHWLAESRHAARVATGELLIDLDGVPPRTRVAARPLDLAHALDESLARIFSRGQVSGPVRFAARTVSPPWEVVIEMSWSVRDRFHVEPSTLTESLRILASYGARLELDEGALDGVIRLRAALPALEPPGAVEPGQRHADAS